MFSRSVRAVPVACLIAASLVGRASADEATQPSSAPLRVLILSGRGDHGWRATTPALRRILDDSGRFDVRVCEAPEGLTPRSLADFDVVVDNAALAPGGDTEEGLARFVESGKGLVVTRGALGSLAGKPTAGTDSAGAARAPWPVRPSQGTPTPTKFLKVKIARDEHPITRGLKGETPAADALLGGLTLLPGSEVIASAVVGDGKEEPVVVASEFGKGRVFCTALGHDASAMQGKAFVATLARGAEWAATGKVTLPADLGPTRPAPGAVKALLITGGHDHEAAFYSLFNGDKDLGRLPVAPSSTAFQKDLRGKYDVIVMYDFSRDLDDVGKKNLRDFVEAGHGVVVLHHALLNYQKWTWWYQDTVGGSYRLSREGNAPSSGVKDGETFSVTPESGHPITAGIEPFQVVDEAYNRMWMSPRVRPLLTTDNPHSDRVLAWVGPNESARVVAIQLGHGPWTFGHPSYRALVHNAILWASGRTK